ncbi:hypothetical protein AVP42_00316 [Agromyces sp. NDB4Y10]|uniref:hypothetical protein n=1 Tax=Agromyces sp. NDB4Y10 TaxID=1775951 RepID=UPI0007B2BE43|nr:hypothetical protein [Agromyces sp. NDB4Y10]KZE95556.1 hypothetical protein AVP42_00316 [Agromyces sp. NDB4Y10]
MKEAAPSALGGVSVFALLVVRGLLLWIVIPVGFIAWLLFGWVLGVGAGQFLGWVDLNLIAALQRVLVHRVNGEWPMPRVAFVPIAKLQSVRHRVSVLDPV